MAEIADMECGPEMGCGMGRRIGPAAGRGIRGSLGEALRVLVAGLAALRRDPALEALVARRDLRLLRDAGLSLETAVGTVRHIREHELVAIVGRRPHW